MDFSNKTTIYFLSVLIFFVSISAFMYPIVSSDSGYYLANARDLYNGNKYFIDIATAYNPLSILAIGIPFMFFDLPDSRFSLAINFVIIFSSALLLFKILNTIAKDKNRNIFFSLYFVLCSLVLDGSHIMLEPLSVFFLLFALFFYIKFNNKNNYWKLAISGVFISLAFLAKQYGLFLLLPFGIDILLKKENILKKGFTLAFGFCFPVAFFALYLVLNGLDITQSLFYMIGKGVKIDVGNGTGRTFTLMTYSLGYVFFFLCNSYLLLIPFVLKKNWKSIISKKSIILLVFPFSFLVLVSASYVHYFQYVLPFAILFVAFLFAEFNNQFPKFLKISFLLSISFMIAISVYSFSNKKRKYYSQLSEKNELLLNVPAKSKVFFEGPSPSYYYLCNYYSIELSKIGYSFPGYFYSSTIVKNLKIGSYVIISDELFYIYKDVIKDDFSQSLISLNEKKYRVLKRIK